MSKTISILDLPASAIVSIDRGLNAQTFIVYTATKAEGNANEHFRARSRRAKQQRAATRRAMQGLRLPALPVRVTMIRASAGMMDDDNLAGCFKHIRDEIAALYGTHDGPTGPIRWEPAQEKAPRRTTPRVQVIITRNA